MVDGNKLSIDHADFLKDMAFEVGLLLDAKIEDIERISRYTKWAFCCGIEHGFKHGVEWAEERNRKRYP